MLCFVRVILNYMYMCHTNPKAVILDLLNPQLSSFQTGDQCCILVHMYMHYFHCLCHGCTCTHVYTGGELHYSCQLLSCSEKTSQETVQKASQLP